jgi:patatin-like phospholipase/acyl hydrolase
MNKDYNILSLDGGGVRGIILLHQLVYLEKNLDRPIHEEFQLIAGTSTGAIIGTLLSVGYTAQEIFDVYKDKIDDIFDKKFLRFGVFNRKYESDNFKKLLDYYLNDHTLKDAKTDLFVPTYNVSEGEKLIFKSSLIKRNIKEDFKLSEVVLSSAAAPTFFELPKIKGNYYMDGGMVINNPAKAAYLEAKKFLLKDVKINVLSFSTGKRELKFKRSLIKGGMIQWASFLVNTMLQEQAILVDHDLRQLEHIDNTLRYVRCESQIKFSTGKIDDASKKNLKNMLKDGAISVQYNKRKILNFIRYR